MNAQNRYKDIARSAIFLCLISLCAIISIPIGAIPITLQTFAITLCAYMCTPKQSAIAIWSYLLLGAAGCPIFASMHGGIGSILGPSGGFLWGYALFLPFASFLVCKVNDSKKRDYSKIVLLASVGIAMTLFAYITGTFQYMLVANVDFYVAVLTAVVPFALFDFLKIVIALTISRQLSKLI